MKSLIYQLKGCFDVELAKIFLEQYLFYLKIKYAGYVIVPIPSNKVDDDKREFNHVIEIFKYLNLPTYNVLYKSEKYKQSDQKASDRHLIEKYLKMSDTKNLINKKILLVDDIVTTGSTLRAAIKLLSNIKVKDIKILVVAKTMSHS